MNNKKLSVNEVSAFCTQLSILLNAGITPYESISLMIDDSSEKSEQSILDAIRLQLQDGNSLSSAIASTNLFPEYMINMLTLGEETGSLDKILLNLSQYYDQQCSIKESVRNAIIYPTMMVLTMFFMLLILLTKILPTINQVYNQLGTSLSNSLISLFNLSSFLQSISLIIYILFFILLAAVYASFILLKEGKFKQTIFFKLPFAKAIANDIANVQFASCLALISGSGIDIFKGLSMCQNIVSNNEMKTKITNIIQYIKDDGCLIHEALRRADIFSPLSIRMIQIGYKAGNPDLVLNKISKQYEDSIHNRLQRLLSTIEPTLVIIFSVIVGLILVSALLPLIGIMASIG